MSILAESAAIMLGDIKNDTEPLGYTSVRTMPGTVYEENEFYLGKYVWIGENDLLPWSDAETLSHVKMIATIDNFPSGNNVTQWGEGDIKVQSTLPMEKVTHPEYGDCILFPANDSQDIYIDLGDTDSIFQLYMVLAVEPTTTVDYNCIVGSQQNNSSSYNGFGFCAQNENTLRLDYISSTETMYRSQLTMNSLVLGYNNTGEFRTLFVSDGYVYDGRLGTTYYRCNGRGQEICFNKYRRENPTRNEANKNNIYVKSLVLIKDMTIEPIAIIRRNMIAQKSKFSY